MKKIILSVLIILFLMCTPKDNENPVVTINQPSNNSFTYNDSIYVQIIATDNRGVEKVDVFSNDSLFITFTKRPFEFYILTENFPDSTILKIFSIAYDYSGNIGLSDTVKITILKDLRPIVSQPFGDLPDEGVVNTPYTFKAFAHDNDDDSLCIRFFFGDGDTSTWSNMVKCGDTIQITHSFMDGGTYSIKAQAKDKRGKTSFWSQPFNFKINE